MSPATTESERPPSRCTVAGPHRVDGRAVRSRDVDAEMKRRDEAAMRGSLNYAAHRVGLIERFERPVVQAPSVARSDSEDRFAPPAGLTGPPGSAR